MIGGLTGFGEVFVEAYLQASSVGRIVIGRAESFGGVGKHTPGAKAPLFLIA